MKKIIVLFTSLLCSMFTYSQTLKLDLELPSIQGASNQNSQMPEHHDHNMHMHEALDISHYSSIPELKIELHKDLNSGWNLRIMTSNFSFSPENVNKNEMPNLGHAHLYIDGAKITRLYGEWYYIAKLEKGMHSIRVTLNSNNHSELSVGDIVIDAKRTFLQD